MRNPFKGQWYGRKESPNCALSLHQPNRSGPPSAIPEKQTQRRRVNQVVQLACSDTFLNDLLMYFATGVYGGISLTGILYSYSKVVSSILGISSARGKYKAFSTCASHLSVVSLFYCTVLGVYLSSAATHSSQSSAVSSVMYTVVTPVLNPFIYSLRNKDIKRALKRIIGMAAI